MKCDHTDDDRNPDGTERCAFDASLRCPRGTAESQTCAHPTACRNAMEFRTMDPTRGQEHYEFEQIRHIMQLADVLSEATRSRLIARLQAEGGRD